MITEDYVSFEISKLLKEKGFDAATFHDYDERGIRWFEEVLVNHNSQGGIACPTLQMAMKWLREVHHIFIDITSRFSINADNDVCFSYSCKKLTDKYEIVDGEWLCYEQACKAAIK